jgi:hypothetical protein
MVRFEARAERMVDGGEVREVAPVSRITSPWVISSDTDPQTTFR